MKPVYKVVTPKLLYVCEVFDHPTKGFVWEVNGRLINYAVPTKLKTSRERLLFQVRNSFSNNTLLLETA